MLSTKTVSNHTNVSPDSASLKLVEPSTATEDTKITSTSTASDNDISTVNKEKTTKDTTTSQNQNKPQGNMPFPTILPFIENVYKWADSMEQLRPIIVACTNAIKEISKDNTATKQYVKENLDDTIKSLSAKITSASNVDAGNLEGQIVKLETKINDIAKSTASDNNDVNKIKQWCTALERNIICIANMHNKGFKDKPELQLHYGNGENKKLTDTNATTTTLPTIAETK